MEQDGVEGIVEQAESGDPRHRCCLAPGSFLGEWELRVWCEMHILWAVHLSAQQDYAWLIVNTIDSITEFLYYAIGSSPWSVQIHFMVRQKIVTTLDLLFRMVLYLPFDRTTSVDSTGITFQHVHTV